MNNRRPMFTIWAMSGTTTATADSTHMVARQNNRSDAIGTGMYRQSPPALLVGNTNINISTRANNTTLITAITLFTGNNNMGNTALRSSVRFAFTDPMPLVTASLNPRYGISPANTNSTNS